MNDLLKASKRVLKTLSQLNLGDYPPPLQGGLNDEIEDLFEAIKKAENQKSMALEEFIQTYQKGYREGKEDALAQPEQGPVAWMTHTDGFMPLFHKTRESALNWQTQPTPLYTAPLKREWVGLTDADKQEACIHMQKAKGGFWEFADYLDAKLKEKNT